MYNLRRSVAVCWLVVFASAVQGQDKARPDTKVGDEMIYKYLCAETDKLSGKFLGGAKTIAEWKQARPRHYQEYMDMLGLWPIPEKTPLKAVVTGTLEAHGVVVEKIHFQSKPGLYVTANLYRPKDEGAKRKPLPAIVYVCGHSNRGRDGNKTAFQDHGFWFANNGYVCIVLDTLQLGEIPGVHHGTYGVPWNHIKSYEASRERERPENVVENRWWWHSIGYTPAGVEAWNGVRAVDYLETRPEVDPQRIGVTGISGGGAATFWIAAADDRVKVAVPVSGMSDLESYVKNKVINGHCDCMFLYNTYQWDWTTIAAMVAPRPMLFANSDNDSIFPMDGNRRIMEKLRKIYGMYGRPNDVQEYVSEGGHDYRPDLRIAIFKFFNKHLKGDEKSAVEDSAKYTPLKGRELRVFPTDADVPKDAINDRIDETFVPMAKVKLPEKGKFEEWKKERIKELTEKVFRNLADIGTVKFQEGPFFGSGSAGFHSESGLPVLLGIEPAQERNFTLIIQGGSAVLDNENAVRWAEQEKLWKNHLGAGRRVLFWPRRGMSQWAKKSPPNFVERAHVLLGQEVDAKDLWDIVALSQSLGKDKMHMKRIGGTGREGILAAYAALFQPSIEEVIVINPPRTHMQGPYFLNALRVLDIPEALGLLAPRPLTIIGGKHPAFNRTEEIYRLAGAADKLTRK